MLNNYNETQSDDIQTHRKGCEMTMFNDSTLPVLFKVIY